MANNAPMTAMVEFQVRTATTSLGEWLDVWAVRAEDARTGEPGTSAYGALVSESDDSHVLVFERYVNGAESLSAHVDRDAHRTLTETMGERNMTRRRVFSARIDDLPGFGWWSRPERAEPVLTDAVLSVLGMRFDADSQRDTFVQLTAQHADWCLENEPDTLIYSGGLAAADGDRGPDIRRGDLIFFMLCTDMAATEKHRVEPRHLELGDTLAQAGIEIHQTFLHTYRSTGHGYMWRQPE